MKLFVAFILGLVTTVSPAWLVDFEQAKLAAKNENKYILLNFSGSDWCGPCIRMTREIFESGSFLAFADKRLVLVNADFPRSKKHALTAEQQKKNDQLAELYNTGGKFPLTLLLTNEGKVIKTWEGYPPLSPEEFTQQIDALTHAGN